MAPSRSTAAALAIAGSLLLTAAHVLGRATRDGLFLSTFPVTVLPRAMVGAAAIQLLSAALMSRLLARHGPSWTVPGLALLSALLFATEWWLVRAAPPVGTVLVYLHIAGTGGVLLSGFWSVVSERFDPHSGKAIIARIGGFGALGGVLGGLAGYRLAPALGAPAMLLGLLALHVAGGCLILGVGRGLAGRRTAGAGVGSVASGLRILRGQPFLLQMALLMMLIGAIEELVDYAFKAQASFRFRDEASLVGFFALFYTACNALAFLLQTALGARVLRSFGLGGAMALLPAGVAMAGAAATAFTRLVTVSIARACNAVLAVSFFRSGFELLYTPLPPETKRPTKSYIDVAADSVGDMSGGFLILGLLFFVPGLPIQVVLAIAVAACIGALLLVARLQRGYVAQLAENLRSGAVSLDESQPLDAATARAVAESRVTIDRAELQARLQELELGRAPEGEGARPAERERLPSDADDLSDFVRRVGEVCSGNRERIRAVLSGTDPDPRLVPHVLSQLGRFDVPAEVVAYLRSAAPRCVGVLNDALLDPESAVLVRRRVPRVIEAAGGERAIAGLCLGFQDPDFGVRLECARSAARIIDREPQLRLPRARVVAWAEGEASVDQQTWEQRGRRLQGIEERSFLLEGVTELQAVNRSVEHVFTLLALALGSDVMRAALRALYGGDENLRGTGLEYLETVLPESLRATLWPRLPVGDTGRRVLRSSEEIEGELLGSASRRRRLLGPR